MQVRAELDRARVDLEQEGRSTQIGKLCATPFGVDIVGITEFVALVGALVGGEVSGFYLVALSLSCCLLLPLSTLLVSPSSSTSSAPSLAVSSALN